MQLSAIVEALLIASQNPLPSEEIARLVRARVAEAEDVKIRETEEGKEAPVLPDWLLALATTTAEEITAAIAELNQDYQENQRAFTIIERPKGWKVFTRIDYGEFVRQLFPGRKPERMSGPAMETLAIIAYRQPITKAAIEAVRGESAAARNCRAARCFMKRPTSSSNTSASAPSTTFPTPRSSAR